MFVVSLKPSFKYTLINKKVLGLQFLVKMCKKRSCKTFLQHGVGKKNVIIRIFAH